MAAKNKTLIIGTGRLGSSIANRASSRGDNVIVIDADSNAFGRLDETFTGYKVRGDATDLAILESDCYIKTCEEVVITTGDDNINLFLAHVCALIYGVPRIFVRFDDPEKGALIAGMPSIEAIYPFELSLGKFTALEKGAGK